MPDPRRFDLIVRSATTAVIALGVIAVAAVELARTGSIDPTVAGWGGIILGVYFGSHTSLNGSGVRAARDQQMTAQLLEATKQPPPVPAPASEEAAANA